MDNNAFNEVKAFQTPFLYSGPFAKACSQLMGQTVQAALQQLIIISSKYDQSNYTISTAQMGE